MELNYISFHKYKMNNSPVQKTFSSETSSRAYQKHIFNLQLFFTYLFAAVFILAKSILQSHTLNRFFGIFL